jgi:trk system potassium uptake protein TrkH
MISGAINFTLFYFLITGKGKRLIRDEELHWFLWIIVILSVLVGIGLIIARNYDIFTAFRISFFQIISIITTTGFITDDFFAWGSAFLIPFMLAMIVCGCVGSTSGGLKVVRAVVLVKNTFCELKRMMHPRAIIPVRLNGSAVPFNVVQRLLAFAFLYVMIIFISWGVLLLAGAPFVDSLGAVISSLGNVGPGFGTLGGYGSYVDLPVFVKWYLSFLMIVGRLEIFTVLILFTPGFWKR